MINISDVVFSILSTDEVALEAVRRGFMNYSKYARYILKETEKRAMKNVDEKSIVVSLTRIATTLKSKSSKEQIKLLNLSVHSNLEEISYHKTPKTIEKLFEYYSKKPQFTEGFFTSTQGMTEITFVADHEIIKEILNVYKGESYSYHIDNLSGITAKFPIEYIDVPNVIHEISATLAIKNINIIEVVSTTSEITYIVKKEDTQNSLSQLAKLL